MYSSLSWYDFFKNETTKPHCNSSTLNTDESRRSEDAVTTGVKKRRRKPDRGQEVLRLYTQVSLFKDQKSRLMIQRSGHCWSLCRKGLKYFLHTRVVFRFLSKHNFPCLNRKLLILARFYVRKWRNFATLLFWWIWKMTSCLNRNTTVHTRKKWISKLE